MNNFGNEIKVEQCKKGGVWHVRMRKAFECGCGGGG